MLCSVLSCWACSEAENNGDAGPTDASAEITSLKPTAAPSAGLASGKLAEPFDDLQGGTPVGWDSCGAPGLTRAPRANKADPAAPSGANYMVFSSAESTSTSVGANPHQMFFYFPNEWSLEKQGLWFDVRRLSGESQSLRLLLASTSACQAQRAVGLYDLINVARSEAWTRTCAPLPRGSFSTELGLRIEGTALRPSEADLVVAFDSFALGPACP